MEDPRNLEIAIVASLLIIAAWRDVAVRLIPYFVPILTAVAGFGARCAIGPRAAIISLAGAAIIFVILALIHRRGLLGGGDVTLMAAFACGLSPPQTYQFILYTSVSGGVLAAVWLLLQRLVRRGKRRAPPPRGTPLPMRVLAAERWRLARKAPLPYAVAIAMGGLLVLGQHISR